MGLPSGLRLAKLGPVKAVVFGFLLSAVMSLQANPVAIVVHGGAGRIERESLTPELERLYHETLERSLRAGHEILRGGGSACSWAEAGTVGTKAINGSAVATAFAVALTAPLAC